MKAKYICVALIVALNASAFTVSAADGSEQFSLAKAVPANSWIYVHGAHNDERDFLEKHWSHVWEAVAAVNLDKDIKKMVLSAFEGEEDRTEFEAHWDKAVELFHKIKWGELIGKEVVYFNRLAGLPEYTVLFRSNPESVDHNLNGLRDIMTELSGLHEDLTLTPGEFKDAKLWQLSWPEAPVALCLFQRKDVVGLCTSRPLLEEVVGLMTGATTNSLVETDRFKNAMRGLPKPEDTVVFMDMPMLFTGIRQVMDMATESSAAAKSAYLAETKPGEAETQPSETAPDPEIAIVKKLIDHADFIDTIAITEETKGLQTFQHSVVSLSATGKQKPLCKVLTAQKPLDQYNRHVPKEALGFWVWSGMDMLAAYNFVLDFVKNEVPEGPDNIMVWEQMQTDWEFNLKDDLFSWMEGQMIGVQLKPAVQTMFASPDFVFMLKVKDEKKATETFDRLILKVNDQMANSQQQQMLLVTDAADINAEGFKSISYPAMAMMGLGKMVYGLKEGWLVVSNSTAAVNACLATASGSAPSFYENERFRKEGLMAEGPVAFASFSDLSNSAQEMAMAMGMLQMSAAMMPPDPETQVIKSILGMVGKLSPAVSKMNFTLSSSSTCKFDGNRWATETVTTYKEYVPPPKEPEAGEAGKTEEGKSIDGL